MAKKVYLPDFEEDIYGNTLAFDGNPNLKKAGAKLPWTAEHVKEWKRCKEDWKYFAEKYHHILDIDKGMTKIKLRDYQREMVDNFFANRFNIVLASRQIGKSTSFEIYILHYILFSQDKTVAVLANKAEQSVDILRKVKQAYELLPRWLQQGVKRWNESYIALENGCMVRTSSTSSSAIRGKSISLLIIDEAAFVPPNVWENFYSSTYPTISSGKESKVIFVSTPNGLNHFYRFWEDAHAQRNKFTPYRVDWWQVPGRDKKWKDETLSNVGPHRFRQEYGNDFLGSADTLIDPDILKQLRYSPEIETSPLIERLPKSFQKFVHIYEEPIQGHTYVMGVDPSRMTEERAGDACALQVLDITKLPFRQVATFYADSGFNYMKIPQVAYELGKYYKWATVFIENNDVGSEVAHSLNYDYEYEGVFFERTDTIGFKTTKKTKRLGTTNLQVLVENNKLVLNDFTTISELSTFIRHKDTYRAEETYHDDAVMALIAALFFMQRREFEVFEDSKEMTERLIEHKQEMIEEDVPLFGFTPDDIENDPMIDFAEF